MTAQAASQDTLSREEEQAEVRGGDDDVVRLLRLMREQCEAVPA